MNKIYPYCFILLAVIIGAAFILPDRAYSSMIDPGGVSYNISQAKGAEPKFLKVEIDPLKVVPGSVQKMRAVMVREQNIVSVKASIKTDNKITEVPLSLTGYENNNPVYTAEWAVEDTHAAYYRTTFTAGNSEGKESSFTLTWDDALCGASTCTFSTSCNTGASQVTCSNSNVTINNGVTVTINNGGALKWTGGYNVYVNGTLAISDGGVLTRAGYQWYYDYDGDWYRDASKGWKFQDSSPGSYWVRQDLHATGGDDCCDTDINAHPNQTAYYTSTNACGSWDYNCNGSADKQYTRTGSCSQVSTWECGSLWDEWYKAKCSSGYPCWFGGVPSCGQLGDLVTSQGNCSGGPSAWMDCWQQAPYGLIKQPCH
jgi:hypothetical protein